MSQRVEQSLSQLLHEAFVSLRTLGKRSVLALLGIVIGSSSVVALINIGHNAAVDAALIFKDMGTDTLVAQFPAKVGSSRPMRTHLDLDAVRQAFVTKGFDGASMQDLARAAGMSVGNFYRYFPSKAAIVQAMCGYDLAEIEGEFAQIQTSDTPMICLRDRILNHFSEESLKDGQLWAEITAAEVRTQVLRGSLADSSPACCA